MKLQSYSGVNQASVALPEALRLARLTKLGIPPATARLIAILALGEPRDLATLGPVPTTSEGRVGCRSHVTRYGLT